MRPSFLRTTFQESAPSMVTDKVVPASPGWSVPSAAIVSALPAPKSKAYLLPPALATFIMSISLLLDAFSFHSPRKGSFAAANAPVARQATSTNLKAHLSMESSLLSEYGEDITSDDQDFIKRTGNPARPISASREQHERQGVRARVLERRGRTWTRSPGNRCLRWHKIRASEELLPCQPARNGWPNVHQFSQAVRSAPFQIALALLRMPREVPSSRTPPPSSGLR